LPYRNCFPALPGHRAKLQVSYHPVINQNQGFETSSAEKSTGGHVSISIVGSNDLFHGGPGPMLLVILQGAAGTIFPRYLSGACHSLCECWRHVETKETAMKVQISLFALMTVMLAACDEDQIDPCCADGAAVGYYVPYWPESFDRQTRQKDRALLMDAELPDPESGPAQPER
jgi:hypothetical protein